jgi:hypothetical protein
MTAGKFTAVIQDVIRDSKTYRTDIDAGEEKIRTIRKYLDEMDILPACSRDTQIGSPDALHTFPNFQAWVASFSRNNLDEEAGDDVLLREFKRKEHLHMEYLTGHIEAPFVPEIPNPDSESTPVRLIIKMPVGAVEQLFFQANTKIEDVLRVLKDKGIFHDLGHH